MCNKTTFVNTLAKLWVLVELNFLLILLTTGENLSLEVDHHQLLINISRGYVMLFFFFLDINLNQWVSTMVLKLSYRINIE